MLFTGNTIQTTHDLPLSKTEASSFSFNVGSTLTKFFDDLRNIEFSVEDINEIVEECDGMVFAGQQFKTLKKVFDSKFAHSSIERLIKLTIEGQCYVQGSFSKAWQDNRFMSGRAGGPAPLFYASSFETPESPLSSSSHADEEEEQDPFHGSFLGEQSKKIQNVFLLIQCIGEIGKICIYQKCVL